MSSESLIEELVDQDAYFRKFVHAHLNFEINILVVDNVVQVVFFDHIVWEDLYLHLRVPWLGQRCFEVEVFKLSVTKRAPVVEMT